MSSSHRLIAVALSLAPAAAMGDPADPPDLNPPVPGCAVVRLAEGTDLDAFLAQCEADHEAMGLDLTVLEAIEARSTYLVTFDPQGLTAPQLAELELNLEGGYLDALLSWGGFAYEAQGPEGNTGSVWFFVPDGLEFFTGQYATSTLNLGAAHTQSTGQGAVVAVLDTGVDALHPQLAGRVLDGGFNFIEQNTDTSDAGDGQDNDGDGVADELVGHGTFVSSLITLVAPEARILPVRVLNGDGIGSDWSVACGIEFAVSRGVEVINLSLGSTHRSPVIEEAIEQAIDLGIVVVGAAGNANRSEPEVFPAMESAALGVAAADDGDVKALFSNYNDDLAITAPGSSVVVDGAPDLARSIIGAVPGGGFAAWEGTSFATAYVSGAVALVRAQHPEWPQGDLGPAEIAGVVEGILGDAAVNIDALNPEFAEELGDGRLDVGAAVLAGPPMPAAGDLDADGSVGIADFLALLSDWGLTHSSADLDGDGTVGILDLLIMFGNWG